MNLYVDPVPDAVFLAAGLERIRLAAGEVLFRQGDRGDAMYMLAAGQMDIQVQVPDGDERLLCTLEPNAIMGEVSLLLDEPRIATLVARTEAELWRISRDDFKAAIGRGTPWSIGFLLTVARKLARRLTATNEDLVLLIDKVFQKSQPRSVAEIEQLCDRLLRQWSS